MLFDYWPGDLDCSNWELNRGQIVSSGNMFPNKCSYLNVFYEFIEQSLDQGVFVGNALVIGFIWLRLWGE